MSACALTIPGTHNSRDLGCIEADGVRTRRGMILRSDAPVRLGAEGRTALEAVGLRTAIDLREPVERALDPVNISDSGIALIEWPLIDGRVDLTTPIGMAPLYGEIIDRCGERIVGAANLLGVPDALPALVFCSAGKDRTGLVAGLVLSAVGVSDEDVVGDYAKSERSLSPEFRAELAARAAAAGFTRQPAVTAGAPASIMRQTLVSLRERHGGTAEYLLSHGMSGEALALLRECLLARG